MCELNYDPKKIKEQVCWCCGTIIEAIVNNNRDGVYGTNEIVRLVSLNKKDGITKREMSPKTAYHHIVHHLIKDGFLVDSDEFLLNSYFEFQLSYSMIYREKSELAEKKVKELIHKIRKRNKRSLTLSKPKLALEIKTLAS